MNEIYQSDIPPFPKSFDTACYVMSILWQLNRIFGKPEWTYDAIITTNKSEQVDSHIEPDETVKDPQAFCDHIVGSGKVNFLGKFSAFYVTASNEFEILVFHKDGNNFDHFCAGDGHGLVGYDPWSAKGSDSVKQGQCIGKRIFRIL